MNYFGEYFDLPVCVIVEIELSYPWVSFDTTFDSIIIGSVIMPDCSFVWWRGWNSVVYFAVNDIVVTFGIKRGTGAGVKNKIRLICEDKINAGWPFIRSKVSRFLYNLSDVYLVE